MADRILRGYVKFLLTVVAMYMYITFSGLVDISTGSSRDTVNEYRHRVPVTQQKPLPIPAPVLNTVSFEPPGASMRIQTLFEHAAGLSTSKLQHCSVQTRHVSFSNSQYNLLIPQWQTQPRKQHHLVTAILRVRLYSKDKARWTMAELKQWIHYQLWAGVEHIYICNDYVKKEEDLAEGLSGYSKAGLVTVLDWSDRKMPFEGQSAEQQQIAHSQVSCYNYVKKLYGRWSTWMLSLDMDENPYCPLDHCEGFLARYLGAVDQNVSAILVENYVLHGQGDRSRDTHYDRLNRISPGPQNETVKPIFKVRHTQDVEVHSVVLLRGQTLAKPKGLRMLRYWGGQTQDWGPNTKETMSSETLEFNDVRESIAVAVRHSLLAFAEFGAFSNSTGP